MGALDIKLDRFLTPSKVKEYIKSSPIQPRQITKELYSKDVATHPSPIYSYANIKEVVGNVPLVLRGGEPINISEGNTTYNYIEPQPIKLTETLTAVELNNMKSLGAVSIEKIIKEKIARFRNIVLNTVEALAIQSLTGKIEYQLKTQGIIDKFIVKFGDVEKITPTKKPENIQDLYNILVEVDGALQEKGYGQNIVFYAGKDAYAKVIEIAGNYQGKVPLEFKDGGVNIGGYFIKPVRSGYKDENGKFVKAIPDKILKAVDKSAPFRLRYLAIDDVEANLQPMPIFIAQQVKEGNISLRAQSKPLVIPVPDAIVDVEIA